MKIALLVASALLASTALVQTPAEYKKAIQQQPPPPPVKAPDSKPGLTGQVSEEEFKKMHELKKDAPPALTGSAVEIGTMKGYLSLP